MRLPPGLSLNSINEEAEKIRRRRGRSAKSRGSSYEKLIAEIIGTYIGLPASDVFRTRTGSNKEDIGLSAEAAKRFPFSCECKNQKTIHLPEWWRQSVEHSKKNGLFPIVILKLWNGKPGQAANNLVVIDLQDFMGLVIGDGK